MIPSTASLKEKLTQTMDAIEALPPLKRHFLLAGIGAASILPGVFSFKLVSLAVVLAGAAGMVASEFDRKADGGNKNMASVVAGAFLMGVTLAPFADVPDLDTHMTPADRPEIVQPMKAAAPAQIHAAPQVLVQ